MIKLMIVEDEWLVREGLKSTIPWDELKCEVIAEADNGITALERLQEIEPDIILSDIRMPGMDGLEMAKLARQKFPNVEVVFLTGFGDFSYAQRALQIGSADYVLKPTNPDELMEVIDRVANKVRKRKASGQAERFLQQTRFKNSGRLLVSKLLYDLLMDSAGEKELELFIELTVQRPEELACYQVGLLALVNNGLDVKDLRKLLMKLEALLYDTPLCFTRVQDQFAIFSRSGRKS